jgi:DNA-binding transcriptional ArsR family regulator
VSLPSPQIDIKPSGDSLPVSRQVDEERMSTVLKALAHPARLDLLRQLRSPRSVGEIRLRSRKDDGHGLPDRPMSRVSVRAHLDQLLAIGAVEVRREVRDGRLMDVFVVNARQMFALTEELRTLGRPAAYDFADGTLPGAPADAPVQATGTAMTLVSGVLEGACIPLAGAGPWRIGRAAQCSVAIDYDPYASLLHAEVRRTPAGFELADLGKARNGTWRNWVEVPPGGATPLATGDILRIGHTIMVFRA